MRRAWSSSWTPMLGAVCVWACYGPAWALSGLSAQAWLGNTAYRGADLLVSLLLLSRHRMPGSVRWRYPFLLPAGVYHVAASGLFAMAVGWCSPLLAAALYELWPLWTGVVPGALSPAGGGQRWPCMAAVAGRSAVGKRRRIGNVVAPAVVAGVAAGRAAGAGVAVDGFGGGSAVGAAAVGIWTG